MNIRNNNSVWSSKLTTFSGGARSFTIYIIAFFFGAMPLTWQTPFPCQSTYIYNRETKKHHSPNAYTRQFGSKAYLYYRVTHCAVI